MSNSNEPVLIKQMVDELIQLYPGLFQWFGGELYFSDKRITHLAMDLKLYRGFSKGGNVLYISWKGEYNRNNYIKLSENRQSGTIELTSDHHTIADAACLALFDMGIDIMVCVNDYGTVFNYDEANIKRRHTIKEILK